MDRNILIAQTILDGFNKHYRLFRELSASAKERFERAAWEEAERANIERIQMYDLRVKEAVTAVSKHFPDVTLNDTAWPAIKIAYISLLHEHLQPELAETFFNSVACRVLHRQYYHNKYIFWRSAIATEYLEGNEPTYRSWYPEKTGLKRSLLEIVTGFGLKNKFVNLRRDLRCLYNAFEEHFPKNRKLQPNHQFQVLSSLFFRNKAAYIVGRELNGHHRQAFMIPILQNTKGELYLDALLVDEEDISLMFSFSRAYFMVDMQVPSAYVQFLLKLMPRKPKMEIYTILGLQKHGKTLFYREMQHHVKNSSDDFIIAPGIPGMVMLVFTMRSLQYVFKIIKDNFEPPKESNRDEVKAKYQLVKNHDRVGRMADTLEYSHVAIPLNRIDPKLMHELQSKAASHIEVDGDYLIVRHVYIERRMTPLNEYLNSVQGALYENAIWEYGQAIRDLASANIFPGDMMLKNFGVTNQKRVVFYDYDEIEYMTDCNFRRIPPCPPWMDEMSSEPWYSVKKGDVFPEQFASFFFADAKSREVFYRRHKALITRDYWENKKQAILNGVHLDVFPYNPELRFSRRYQFDVLDVEATAEF